LLWAVWELCAAAKQYDKKPFQLKKRSKYAPFFFKQTSMKKNPVLLFISVILLFTASRCFSGTGQAARQYYEKGLENLKKEKRSEAYDCFRQAGKNDPSNPLYSWAAASAAGNREDAFINAEDAWTKGYKRPEALFFRTALSFHGNRQEALAFALNAYKEMPDSFRTPEIRGDLFFRFEQFDSALAQWEPLYSRTPSARVCTQIALAYSGKGDFQKARSILTEARRKNLLDRAGLSALATLYAFTFEYAAVDTVFRDMHRQGFFNDTARVEFAELLAAQERYDDAVKILNGIHDSLVARGDAPMAFRIRALLYLIYYMEKQPGQIRSIAAMVPKSWPFYKVENSFAAAAAGAMPDSAQSLATLEVNLKALPASSSIDLLIARETMARGNFKKSAACFSLLSPIFGRSPRVLAERATVLFTMGADSAALALINILHVRKVYTKQSLEVFRDIMLKKNILEKGMAAQAVLEKKYPHDAGVILKKGMLALAGGKTDSAFAVFSVLAKEYPDNDDFEVLRLSVLLMQKKYDLALVECGRSRALPSALASVQARALHNSGKPLEARNVYEKLIKEKKTQRLLLDYTSFLLETSQFDRAVPVFKDLVADGKKNAGPGSKDLGLMYNNLAWSCLNADSCPEAELLGAAKRAYGLASDNLHVLDTYAEALLKTGRYDDCIKLLKDNPLAVKEPQLLFHLGTAFEKKNNGYEASRAYASAVSAAGTGPHQLSVNFDTSEISARVRALKTSK
jgi:tetratricopeptide (TPR) repeat protein